MIHLFAPKGPKYTITQSVIVGIGVIAVWRGVWNLLDLYLLPNNEVLSALVSIVLGLCILKLQHHIKKAFL